MQMNLRCGGDFTTNASVVDQISKRQDVCQVSFKILQLLNFCLAKVTSRRHCILFERFSIIPTKLRLAVRGISPVQTDKNSQQRANLLC